MANDEELTAMILREAIRTLPAEINTLEEHIRRQQTKEAGLQAHKIKGAFANIGSRRLTAITATMEQAGKKSDQATLTEELEPLLHAFAKLKKLITSKLMNTKEC